MSETNGTSGIKEIARTLGVSIGTVDRALHGRAGVSEKTKARVLQAAERLGYKPNLAAQALKLNRKLSIAAILPKHISLLRPCPSRYTRSCGCHRRNADHARFP